MSIERPRRTAAQAKDAVSHGPTGVNGRTARVPARVPSGWNTVLVSLKGLDEAREQAANGRSSQYAAMRALALSRRGEVLDYLRLHAEPDGWRAPGEVTAFGTFTIDCTPAALRVLRHAPHVESVVRAGGSTMSVIR